MIKVINSLYEPDYYQRQITNDLPSKKDGWEFPAQRVASLAAPLMMLYQPIAKPISIGMGGIRIITHLVGSSKAFQEGAYLKLAAESSQAGLALLSFAGFFVQFRLGAYITSSADILQNLVSITQHCRERKLELITEDLLQLAANSLYMGIMLSSSMEIILASLVLQVLLNLYQSRKEWKENKTPEALAKLVVACFRLRDCVHYWEVIQFQKALAIGYQKTEALNAKKHSFKLPQKKDEPSKIDPSSKTSGKNNQQVDSVTSNEEEHSPPAIPALLKKVLKDLSPKRKAKGQSHPINLLGRYIVKPLIHSIKTRAAETERRLSISPLLNFQKNVKEHPVVMEDATGKQYNFGAHFHGFGRGLVKGGNLCFREKTTESGQEIIELDFKINHVFREKLQKDISPIAKRDSDFGWYALACFGATKNVTLKEGFFEMGGFYNQKAYQIEFNGIGSILIGADSQVVGMYNRVIIRLENNCTLFQLNKILSFVHLDDALKPLTPMDLERLKIGALFRTFFPKEATLLERTRDFFEMPITQLKNVIVERAPDMKEIFEKCIPMFKPYEILPGRIRYGIEGIGQSCSEMGARALISSLFFWDSNERARLERIGSIFKMGMLSSEFRFANQINTAGLSPGDDLATGGADSVFTQLVTVENFQGEIPSVSKFGYFSDIALIFDLSILDTLTYQYDNDSYGTRSLLYGQFSPYLNRRTVFDFVDNQRKDFGPSNELMVRERILPSYIRGIIVSDQALAQQLPQYLKEIGLTQKESDGTETIFNTPIEQFIHLLAPKA